MVTLIIVTPIMVTPIMVIRRLASFFPSHEQPCDPKRRKSGVRCQGTKPLEPLEPQRQWRHFQITEVFFLDARGFEWQNGHGARNFQRVPRGEVYGRRLQGAEDGTRCWRETMFVKSKPFPEIRTEVGQYQSLTDSLSCFPRPKVLMKSRLNMDITAARGAEG